MTGRMKTLCMAWCDVAIATAASRAHMEDPNVADDGALCLCVMKAFEQKNGVRQFMGFTYTRMCLWKRSCTL